MGDFPTSELLSALQKEIRRGDAPRALFWAKSLQNLGKEDWVLAKLALIVVEDIGLADVGLVKYFSEHSSHMYDISDLVTRLARAKKSRVVFDASVYSLSMMGCGIPEVFRYKEDIKVQLRILSQLI